MLYFVVSSLELRGLPALAISRQASFMRNYSMTKEKSKKEPQKTLKEKRKEKKEKRSGGGKGVSNL